MESQPTPATTTPASKTHPFWYSNSYAADSSFNNKISGASTSQNLFVNNIPRHHFPSFNPQNFNAMPQYLPPPYIVTRLFQHSTNSQPINPSPYSYDQSSFTNNPSPYSSSQHSFNSHSST